MTKKTGVPAIRFKGFTDTWEQRRFSEQYKKVSEKNDLSFGADKIISVANMYFKEEVKESSDDYMKTYNVMRLGDIAFEGNKSKNFAHGRFVENTIGDGIVSHVFDVFRPIADYDLLFWKYIINNEGVMGRIMTRCTKASTMMTNLVADDFLKEEIAVPCIEEQKKIGAYLAQLDNLITLHQRKLEKLHNLKKAMLEKMFPKNGSAYPEIRFAGFTDAWEQREVKALCSISTGKSNTQDKIDEGEYPFYVRSPIVERSNKYLYDEEAVLTVGDGVGTGKVFHYVNGKYDLHQRCYRMYAFSDELNAKYFYHTFSHLFYKRVMAMTAKTSVDSVRLEMISDMEIPTPTIAEQEKVGAFFTNLDNLITLHQRKLEKLQNIKKSMLEKMFV